MSGYRGDGYGMHGDHGDDDFRREMQEGRHEWGGRSRDDDDRRGFMMNQNDGRGEWQNWDDGPKWNERGSEERHLGHRREGGEGMDDRAIHAAEAYRSRYGAQGHEGQYGGGAGMDLDRHGGSERWDSDRERRHNFSGVGRFGTGSSDQQQQRSGRGLHDDHYRSWRDRQIEELDRDYHDYCREREQEFGSAFETWRQQRRSGQSVSPASMSFTDASGASQPQLGDLGMQPGDPSSSSPGSGTEVRSDQQADSLGADESSGGTRSKRK